MDNGHGSHGAATAHAHAAPTGFIRKYIFSTDHKIIGLQYYFLALTAVFVGMFLSLLMRIHLVWPSASILGWDIKPETYLTLLTMHGTIMVFFVLTTAPQGGFGNYFLPIQIGANDMAFPILNMLSFWTTFVGFVFIIAAFFVEGGAPLSGWTNYPPLSALQSAGPGQQMGEDFWLISIAFFCIASMLGALNFITTTLDLRCRGMKMMRLPLTVWSWFITAILGLLAFGVLLAAGVLLLLDRNLGTSFFVPGNLVLNGEMVKHNGGSPLLWQHLFWFFGHPEVYIAILPGMGVTSQILSTFSRKPIFGYKAMVYAMLAIGILGFFVWGHHMFMSGMSPYSAFAFSFMTIAIGVPSAIKTFNWLGTLWKGRIRFTAPMLFAIGFVSLFVSGGLSGPFLAQPTLDIPLHDTFFVVAHFHLIMGVAAIFGIFAATYYWFPKMFGRMMSEGLAKVHFWATFIGAYAIFFPMHYEGLAGRPRRYSQLTEVAYLQQFWGVEKFITIAAVITITAQFVFVFNLFWSMFKGKKADLNPWESTTLEWSTPSNPPPHDNFAGVVPVVNNGPYEYSVPGTAKDYVMQTDPAVATPEGH
ncbi:MAG TPA: cbb3-type cytochrome c oxidase subunit I [Terriglobales bacterium]|nr:cbb3-type cytochrome c oxidase subunit I [Terriglobales bacterium]